MLKNENKMMMRERKIIYKYISCLFIQHDVNKASEWPVLRPSFIYLGINVCAQNTTYTYCYTLEEDDGG